MEITVHLNGPLCSCEPVDNLYAWNITDAVLWVQCRTCKVTLQIPRETLWARWDLKPKPKQVESTPLPTNVVKLFPKK